MNLYVSNIPESVNDTMLEELFRPYGKIISCKLMLNVSDGKSRGYGFVMFEDAACASQAITAMNGANVYGNRITVVVANNTGHNVVAPTRKLWVRNVPSTVPEVDTIAFFQRLGRLVHWTARSDRPELRHYHLEYSTTEEAAAAIKLLHSSRPFEGMVLPLMAKPAVQVEDAPPAYRAPYFAPPYEAPMPLLAPTPLLPSPSGTLRVGGTDPMGGFARVDPTPAYAPAPAALMPLMAPMTSGLPGHGGSVLPGPPVATMNAPPPMMYHPMQMQPMQMFPSGDNQQRLLQPDMSQPPQGMMSFMPQPQFGAPGQLFGYPPQQSSQGALMPQGQMTHQSFPAQTFVEGQLPQATPGFPMMVQYA